MKKQISPTLIGAFTVGAIALTVVAVLVLGKGEFLVKKVEFVCYFEGSVKGLNVGAPVILRGVDIGKVTEIQLRGDPKTQTFDIAVYLEVFPERIQMASGKRDRNRTMRQKIDLLIGRGLRAQLEQQSFITNMMMVVFTMQPDKPAVLKDLEQDRRYVEIPTVKSSMQELMEKVETLPIDQIMKSIEDTLEGIERVVNSPEIQESLTALRDTLVGAKRLVNNLDRELVPLAAAAREALGDAGNLVRNVNGQIDPLAADVASTLAAVRAAVARAEKAMGAVENTTREDSSLIYNLTQTLKELSEAARSLRILAEYLDQHPEALLRGKLDP